jgi:hypothetical protein
MESPKTQWSKSIFVFGVVAFCLVVSAMMGFDQTLRTKVSEIVADGLISLAMFVSVSFLAAQTIDYSGVMTKVGNRLGGRPMPVEPKYEAVDPEAKG